MAAAAIMEIGLASSLGLFGFAGVDYQVAERRDLGARTAPNVGITYLTHQRHGTTLALVVAGQMSAAAVALR